MRRIYTTALHVRTCSLLVYVVICTDIIILRIIYLNYTTNYAQWLLPSCLLPKAWKPLAVSCQQLIISCFFHIAWDWKSPVDPFLFLWRHALTHHRVSSLVSSLVPSLIPSLVPSWVPVGSLFWFSVWSPVRFPF